MATLQGARWGSSPEDAKTYGSGMRVFGESAQADSLVSTLPGSRSLEVSWIRRSRINSDSVEPPFLSPFVPG